MRKTGRRDHERPSFSAVGVSRDSSEAVTTPEFETRISRLIPQATQTQNRIQSLSTYQLIPSSWHVGITTFIQLVFACNIRANAESVGFAASSNKQPPVTLRRYKNNVFDALAADRCLRSSRPMLSDALGTLLQQKANTRAALKPYTACSSQLTMFEKRFRPPQHNLDGERTHTHSRGVLGLDALALASRAHAACACRGVSEA